MIDIRPAYVILKKEYTMPSGYFCGYGIFRDIVMFIKH